VQKLVIKKLNFVLQCYVFILCECKTWSLTSREEHRLRVFHYIKIFESKGDKVTGGGGNLETVQCGAT
jgi:hypothetical protein